MAGIKLNTKQIVDLKALATFGDNGTSWPTKEAKKFETLGVVELGNTTGDETQIRINADGVAYLKEMEPPVDNGSNTGQDANQSGAVAEQKKPSGVKPMQFAIESNVAIPTVARRSRTSAYPFDELEIGQSFFVAATDDRKDPAKALASTVNGANERHSQVIDGQVRKNRKGNEVPATKQLRQFIVRPVVEERDGVEVKGARVWRVEVEA